MCAGDKPCTQNLSSVRDIDCKKTQSREDSVFSTAAALPRALNIELEDELPRGA